MTGEPIVRRPQIAETNRKVPVAVMTATLAAAGLGVFFWMAEARASMESGDELPVLTAVSTPAPAEGEPAMTAQAELSNAPTVPTNYIPNSPPVAIPSTLPRSASAPVDFTPAIAPVTARDRLAERLRAPALVVDLALAQPATAPGSELVQSDSGTTVRTGAPGQPAVGTARAADRNLSDTEQFSARVGNEEVEVAQARRMTDLDRVVPQGTLIGAVMETALNSDLPGFARATVQRDVRSFDGSTILIPAGSRVIGQYKSGIAQGASRVFVLWTRLIRPDGVTINLASPATDELGRGGIGGKVNRHFLQRFGGAILTSVLSAGINAGAAAVSGGSTIIVGSSGEASNLARQASQNSDIPPTIKTRQGAAVRIFVARDLDFTSVGPAR